MNITESIWRRCKSQPEKIAMVADGESTTYQQLLEQVLLVSARLSKAGVKKGDNVSVGLQSPAPLIIVVLALARMGAVVSLFRNSWPLDRKFMILQRHRVQFLLHQSGEEWNNISSPNFKNLDLFDLLQPIRVDETLLAPEIASDVDDLPWWVGLSSGTSGRIKSIVKTHRRDMLSVALSSTGDEKSIRMMVYGDVTGLGFSMLRCFTAGGILILTGSTKPEDFFDVVARDLPTKVVTTTSRVSKLIAFADSQSGNLRKRCASLKSIVLLGGTVMPSILKRVQHHICDQVNIKYGSTEAGLIASMDQDTVNEYPGVRGKLLPWVEAQAVDDTGLPLTEGHKGQLRFRTPLLISEYLDDEKASAAVFRDGWFYPGETGSVDIAGYLHLDSSDRQTGISESPESDRQVKQVTQIISSTVVSPAVVNPPLESRPVVLNTVVLNHVSSEQHKPMAPVHTEGMDRVEATTLPFIMSSSRHNMLLMDTLGDSSFPDKVSKKGSHQINRDCNTDQKKTIVRVHVHEWGYRVDRSVAVLWVRPLTNANEYLTRLITSNELSKL